MYSLYNKHLLSLLPKKQEKQEKHIGRATEEASWTDRSTCSLYRTEQQSRFTCWTITITALQMLNIYNEASPSLFLFYQALPLLCSEQQDTLGFSADLQHLYAAITAHGNARKRKLSEERFVEGGQTSTDEPELTPSSGASDLKTRKSHY